MNTYNIPLTQDQRDYLLTLCATVPDDDAVAQEMLGECGMDHLEDSLRNAEPAQEDALQRLEEENQELREQNKYLMNKCAPF
jgi:hypothetical protein